MRRCAACNDPIVGREGRILMDGWTEETGRDVCGACAHCPPEVLTYEELQAACAVPGDGLTTSQRAARDSYWVEVTK